MRPLPYTKSHIADFRRRLDEIPVYETDVRVSDEPDFVSWFRWRAERRLRSLDRYRLVPFYRYEVVREGRRWAVVAFQNIAI